MYQGAGKQKLVRTPCSSLKTVTTPESIAKVHGMVLHDRRVKVREIGNAIGI